MNEPRAKIVVSAEDRASATFRRIRGEIAGVTASTATLRGIIGPLAPQLAGAFTVAAVGSWLNRVVEGVDALNDLKDATGDSIENLSALEDVALRTGTSLDTAGQAVIKLNQALAAAAKDPDSAAGRAIKNLGLNIKDLLALSPVERLQAVGRAMNSFDDEGKLFYNLVLLGKGTRELAPFMKDLAEAGKLQATVTTQQAEAAEKLRKQWFALEKNSTDLGRSLAGNLVPAVNELFDVLHGRGAGEINEALVVPMQAAMVLGANVGYVLKGIGIELGGIAAQAAAVARLDFTGAVRIGDMMKEDAKAAREEFDKWERRLLGLGMATQASYSNEGRNYAKTPVRKLPALADDGPSKKTTSIKVDSTLDFDPYLEALREIEGTDTVKIKRLNATLAELLQLQSAGMAGPDTAQAIKGVTEQLQKLDPVIQQAAEAKKALDALLADTPAGQDAERLKSVLLINQAFDAGKIGLGTWVELGDLINEKFGGVARTAEAAGAAAKETGNEIGLVFASAAGDAIREWKGVKALIQGIGLDLAQLALKTAITDPLGKSVGGFLGKTLADLVENAAGNAFGPGGLIPFAAGGIVDSPTLFKFAKGTGLMGEAGPEAILPLTRGASGELGVRASGQGRGAAMTYAPVINNVINVDSRSDRAQVGAIVARAVEQGQQQMLQHLRAQGLM
jgi:hypothetical protein